MPASAGASISRITVNPAAIGQKRNGNIDPLGILGQITDGINRLGLKVVNIVDVKRHLKFSLVFIDDRKLLSI